MRDQRTPVPAPRATITVAELAAELGRDLIDMYRLCNAQQVYADGPNCPIGVSNADRLREAHAHRARVVELVRQMNRDGDFAHQYARAKVGALGDPISSDPDAAALARSWNVRPRDRRRDRKAAEPPLTGTAGAAVRHFPHMTHERAQDIALTWARHGFDDTEAVAWWSVGGLRHEDVALAALLRDHGIRPEHMGVRVRGETIRGRLDRDVPVEHLVRVLRDAGEL